MKINIILKVEATYRSPERTPPKTSSGEIQPEVRR
jgi:hypothetical protein